MPHKFDTRTKPQSEGCAFLVSGECMACCSRRAAFKLPGSMELEGCTPPTCVSEPGQPVPRNSPFNPSSGNQECMSIQNATASSGRFLLPESHFARHLDWCVRTNRVDGITGVSIPHFRRIRWGMQPVIFSISPRGIVTLHPPLVCYTLNVEAADRPEGSGNT
jgi:hypothetical protein